MAPKISVIMPMYNVEKYVGLAIGTLLNQTFKDFEAILIDDCSTDRSLEIARSFSDPRIKIIRNEKNFGSPGPVRNIGLERARGEFIYFMDSDDAILPHGLELLLSAIEKNNADISICTKTFVPTDPEFLTFDDAAKFEVRDRGANHPVSKDLKTRIIQEYCNFGSSAVIWLQLHRRKFLKDNDIKFRNIAVNQDGAFLMEKLCRTANIVKFCEPFYVYRMWEGSNSRPLADNFNGFAKLFRSFLNMIEFFDEILTEALQKQYDSVDQNFIDTVCLNIKGRALVYPMKEFYRRSPKKCWEIIDAELTERYGQSKLLRRMMYGYFMECIMSKNAADDCAELTMKLNTIKRFVDKVVG